MTRWIAKARLLTGNAVHCVWFVALIVGVGIAWAIGPNDFYGGGDGQWTQTLIKTYFSFGRPFEVNAINPIEGDFAQLYPLNVWFNPALIQFYLLPFEVAKVTTMFTFLSILAVTMYLAARQFGMGRVPAAISAQCTAWLFPHFTYLAGIFPIYYLNPTATITYSLFIFIMMLVARVEPSSAFVQVVWSGILAAFIACLIVYNDPMTMGLIGFCIAPCFAVVILRGSKNLRGVAARLGVLAIAAGILLAMGLVQYVLALDAHSFRFVYRTEFPREQLPYFASTLFYLKTSTWTHLILLVGLVLGVVYSRGTALTAVLLGWTAAIVATLAGLIYLFVPILWWYPRPIYFQFLGLPFVFLGAVAGCADFLKKIAPLRLAAIVEAGHAVRIFCVLLVPAILIYGATRLPIISTRYYDLPMISELFEDDLALSAGKQWRGSVYSIFRNHREQLAYFSLWDKRIPTFNEVSQTLSPLYWLMAYKVMHAREPNIPQHPTWPIPLGRWDTGLSAAFGIRYLMLPGDAAVTASGGIDSLKSEQIADRILQQYHIKEKLAVKQLAPAMGDHGTPDFIWGVFELPEPNYGQYSPTTVHVAADVHQYRRIFAQPGFDWRTQVAMDHYPGKLTPATPARIHVERGHLRIEAGNAEGRSLLLLPVQYSNCLKISGTGEPQLVRANMFFAGMLFSGKSTARIDFDFGFFNYKCRETDMADLQRLKIPDTVEKAEIDSHPFAVRRWRDLRPRLRQLREVYDAVQ